MPETFTVPFLSGTMGPTPPPLELSLARHPSFPPPYSTLYLVYSCSTYDFVTAMGINKLWELVHSARTSCSLTALAVEHQSEDHGKTYRIGIDASIWLYQCQQTFAIGHAQSGENPELRLIFFRLARLFRLPIIPIFVFDGPSRPALKRGKKVLPLEHWLSQGARHFIDAFGFEWMTAPAEAEAELARLNARGFINSVLTDDSDAFVFGATTIIRNPNVKVDKDHVGIYSADAIRTQIDPALTRGGLYLVAILSGGDYDDGLSRCGAEIARGLARYGLGDTLLAAVTSRHVDLPSFLHGWRSELKTYLSEDPRGYLGRRYKSIAAAVPDTFPDPVILAAYARPLTSGVFESPTCVQPAVEKLARLCEHYFSWGTEEGILNHFRELIWPGLALRVVCPGSVELEHQWTPHATGGMKSPAMPISFVLSSTKCVNHVPSYGVTLSPSTFVKCVQSSLLGLRKAEPGSITKKRKRNCDPHKDFTFFVPKSILVKAHHRLVLRFETDLSANQSKSTKRRTRSRNSSD